LLRLARGADTFTRGTEATDALRELIAHTQVRHPETKIGLTGLPIMENDEMRTSQTSMFWASMISMAGVALLFVAGFGGVRHALLANAILLIGVAWAFAYATATVGHLNILSVTFTLAGTDALSVTAFSTAVLKPISATVTEYVPPGIEGTVKPPSLPVTALYSAPVPLFLILTSAPGMTAPDESTTVPDSEEKKLPCAWASVLATATRSAARRA
jgi:hypothetical protein